MIKHTLTLLTGVLLVGCPATQETTSPATPKTPDAVSCGTGCDGKPIPVVGEGVCGAQPSCPPASSPTATPTVVTESSSAPADSATPTPEATATPTPAPTSTPAPEVKTVSFSTANTILQSRCTPCHISGSSGGANFSTSEGIKNFAQRIKVRVFEQKTMPPGGGSITDEERQQIADWVDAGASIE